MTAAPMRALWYPTSRTADEIIEALTERLIGRYLADDLIDPKTGEVLVTRDKMMTEADAEEDCRRRHRPK